MTTGRMQIFSTIQDYLNSKKVSQGMQAIKIIPNEIQRELFITTHESLRFGEAPYLLQHLNLLKASMQHHQTNQIPEYSLVLCDPYLGNSNYLDSKLLKPFQHFNKINVVHAPISSSVACSNLHHLHHFLTQKIQPKRLVTSQPIASLLQQLCHLSNCQLPFPIDASLIPHTSSSLHFESNFMGSIPSSIAQQIPMTSLTPSIQLSRLQ